MTAIPAIDRTSGDTVTQCVLRGPWILIELGPRLEQICKELEAVAAEPDRVSWDLCAVDALDSAGTLLLWRAWGRRFPKHLEMRDEHRLLFDKWAEAAPVVYPREPKFSTRTALWFGRFRRAVLEHTRGGLSVMGQFILDCLTLAGHPRRIPWREISSTIFQTGATALGITALVSLLIGIVIAYQSALQLRLYGAEFFIVNIVAFSITRELGPILAAILVAGRSGSAMTAQLGVMRLTRELDAMTVLGISVSQRLVLPKVVGLAIALPLLTMWSIALGILGGMMTANLVLDMPYRQFWNALPDTMPLVNLWIGLGKAAMFGALIGLTGAHFGLRVQPNTQSLATEATRSVVTAVTLVIVLDATFSVLFREVGWN